MTFCRESTCWFSSLILSSLAVWFAWTFLLLFSSEFFTSALGLEGFSCNTKTCPEAFCLYQVMPGTFYTKLSKIISITVLHKCSSSCLFSDVDLSRVPICWSAGRSSDEPSNQSMCTIYEYMRLLCVYDKEDTMCCVSCIMHLGFLSVPGGSCHLSFPTFWCKNPWLFPPLFPLEFWGELSALKLQHMTHPIRHKWANWFSHSVYSGCWSNDHPI